MEIFFGWNLEDSNNINSYLILGYMQNLNSYIPSEDIEYLKSIDFTDSTKQISEEDCSKIMSILKEAEQTKLNEQSIDER